MYKKINFVQCTYNLNSKVFNQMKYYMNINIPMLKEFSIVFVGVQKFMQSIIFKNQETRLNLAKCFIQFFLGAKHNKVSNETCTQHPIQRFVYI